MLLTASSTFWPSARTAFATSSEIDVAFAIEPNLHHRAVENDPHDVFVSQRAGVPCIPIALHLAPNPAHRVLAHRAAKQRLERTAHPNKGLISIEFPESGHWNVAM